MFGTFWRRWLPFVALSLIGIALYVVVALLVEAFTDRDWRISGFEWPTDFLTAVLLVVLVAVAVRVVRTGARWKPRRSPKRRTD